MTETYKVKRLFLDIETSLNLVGSFSLWPKSIHIDTIFEDWHIICIAYKWQGDSQVSVLKANKKNDKKLVAKFNKLLSEADEIVYHNGDKFDYKKIQTRALYHGLKPIAKPRSVDTLKQSRKHFSFTSNKLDYIARFLGLGRKINTSMDLWVRVLKGEQAAIQEMSEYCAQDVVVLEDVYNKLMPYMDTGYNYNILHGTGSSCPTCGSSRKQKRGHSVSLTRKYQRYQCKDCGKWFKSGLGEHAGDGGPLR